MGESLFGLRGMTLCQGSHDCTSVATRQVREIGSQVKGVVQAPSKNVTHTRVVTTN